MEEKSSIILWLLSSLILILGLNMAFVVSHEIAHKQVYEDYGCSNTSIQVSFFGVGKATCHDISSVLMVDYPALKSDNNFVDSFGYQLQVVFIGLVVVLLWLDRPIFLR